MEAPRALSEAAHRIGESQPARRTQRSLHRPGLRPRAPDDVTAFWAKADCLRTEDRRHHGTAPLDNGEAIGLNPSCSCKAVKMGHGLYGGRYEEVACFLVAGTI